MNRFLLVASLILFNVVSCKAQEKKDEVIDPIKPSPYKLVRSNSYVNLPDSLGGEEYSGFAFIEGQVIDSLLKISNLKVMKFKLETSNGENYIDYYFGMDSVENAHVLRKVDDYMPFFEHYFSNLKLERIEGVKPEGRYIITVPIKF